MLQNSLKNCVLFCTENYSSALDVWALFHCFTHSITLLRVWLLPDFSFHARIPSAWSVCLQFDEILRFLSSINIQAVSTYHHCLWQFTLSSMIWDEDNSTLLYYLIIHFMHQVSSLAPTNMGWVFAAMFLLMIKSRSFVKYTELKSYPHKVLCMPESVSSSLDKV